MNFKSTVMALSCLTMASSSLQADSSLPTLTPTNAFPYVLSKLSGNVVQLQGSYTNVVNQYVVLNNYYNECNNTVVTALANITATLDSITIPVSAGNSSGSGSSGGGIGTITATLAALKDVIGSLDIEITDVWTILQGAVVSGLVYNRNASLTSGVQNLTDAGHALTVQVNNSDTALSIIATNTPEAYGYIYNSAGGPDHISSNINSLVSQLLSNWNRSNATSTGELNECNDALTACKSGCGGGGSGGEGCGYSTRDIAIPLVNSAISWQQSLLSAFEETTGVTVVPQAVNYLIGYIKGNTSSTIKQAGLDMGVTDFSTVNGVASNGLIDDFTTLISNALGDFIRYEWSQATKTFNATSFYTEINEHLSWNPADYNNQFFQVLPSNFTNRNYTINFDPIGFTGLSVGIQNTTVLKSELEIALQNWAASAEFPLTEADTTSFVNAIIGSSSIQNGNQSTVLGVINTWVNGTASRGLSAFVQEKDFSSTLTSTVDTLVETFNIASKVYVLPQELRTYMANLQVAIVDAVDIDGQADFVTNAYDIATRTAQSQGVNAVYDNAQLPYLATNITQMFTQAIQVVWENNVKPRFTPSTWNSEEVADAVFSPDGLPTYQEQAISSGIQNWFTALNGSFTSSGVGHNDTVNDGISSMISAYKALTSSANVIPPETLSPVNVVDLTTSMETTLGSLYAKIKSLQLKLASFQGQIVDFTSL